MFTADDFNSMDKFEQFNHWFLPTGQNAYSIIRKSDRSCIGVVYQDSDDFDYEAEEGFEDELREEWESYKCTRPEFEVGRSHDLSSMTAQDAVNLYEKLIVGVAFIRAYKNKVDPDTCFSKVNKTLEWLRSGDFYEAPASTIYHECEPTGLLYHTLKVVNKIHELKYVHSFKSINIEDAVLVALVHDWCKIGLYEMYMRNQKNNETGQWEKVTAYKRKDFLLPMGHGATSMWQASKCFKLSTEEALAIRWHQGHWNVCDAEVNEFQQSNETYPLVHMLQFADQLAITKY